MNDLVVIDADAHIVESDAVWDSLEGRDKRFRPTALAVESGPGQSREFWLVDNILRVRFPQDSEIPPAVRDLTDVPGRLRKMDEMGTDIQVIYPTLFVAPFAQRTEAIVALCRGYNQFVANASSQSNGRLRWVVVPPVVSMTDAIAELEFGKGHGACGLVLRGIEGDRILSDPYFYPLYEKAEALNLPVCVHVGQGSQAVFENFRASALFCSRSPVLSSFQDFLLAGIPDRFPKLRFGFIEAGSQWVPYVISEVTRRAEWIARGSKLAAHIVHDMGEGVKTCAQSGAGTGVGDEGVSILQNNRFYVACRMTDDLDYVLRWTGKDNLVTGSDYGHDDYSKDLEAFQRLRNEPGMDAATIDGIRGRNAQKLYAL